LSLRLESGKTRYKRERLQGPGEVWMEFMQKSITYPDVFRTSCGESKRADLKSPVELGSNYIENSFNEEVLYRKKRAGNYL
jgi:hypothetical protein